mgnify:FL=1
MNTLEMREIIQWWSLKSTSPYLSKEEKQYWQDKLDKVKKLVEELDNENILSRTQRLGR